MEQPNLFDAIAERNAAMAVSRATQTATGYAQQKQ
jgi:hypothetical protein